MIDLVGILQTYAEGLDWFFSYGNKANQNLLVSDREEDKIYFLLDPITRDKTKSQYGGDGEVTFSGQFLLAVKSNLDMVYPQRYQENIKPLLSNLESLEDLIDCSDYEITQWSVIDVINQLDVNTDGLVITFKIKTL
jgi:hypothetical protein